MGRERLRMEEREGEESGVKKGGVDKWKMHVGDMYSQDQKSCLKRVQNVLYRRTHIRTSCAYTYVRTCVLYDCVYAVAYVVTVVCRL